MSDWTREAETAIRLCEVWAAKVMASVPCDLFLFGSAIYKGGEQFDREQSDLDIVCLLPEPNSALTRLNALKQLYKFKVELELQMIPKLSRSSCTEPGASIVTLTQLDLRANIHKSGVRNFFSKNFFYNLILKEQSLGLPLAGTRFMKDEHRQALEFVQKVRNAYLSVCANGTGGITEFQGSDPIPKELLRAAAQLDPDALIGEWYDTRLGLELMQSILQQRRSEDKVLKLLFDRVSVRRGGRGQKKGLSSSDQLLLAELLFDSAATTKTEEVVTWEIKFGGRTTSTSDARSALEAVLRIIPEAQLIGIISGSLILRVRSSLTAYNLLLDLQRFGVLAKLLDVESVELLRLDDRDPEHRMPSGDSVEQRLLDRISHWQPKQADSLTQESEFANFLQSVLTTELVLEKVRLERNVQIRKEIPFELDFRLSWTHPDGSSEELYIELVHLRTRANFFQTLERLFNVRLPLVLVAICSIALRNKLKTDVDRLAHLNANIRVVWAALKSMD